MSTDTLIVNDATMAALGTECVEVTPRVQLEQQQKTVRHGPFYSENLPAETLLASVLTCTDADHRQAVVSLLQGRVLRIGGNETIGKGLAWCRIPAAEADTGQPQATATASPATTAAPDDAAAPGGGDTDA